MPLFTNISTYRFAPLRELKSLREKLLGQCKVGNLKGTILLSEEGINLFVAGLPEPIEALLKSLRSIAGLEDLMPKYSVSDHQPFNRMLVRIKKEIISFGIENIQPARHTSGKISSTTLKQWLDEGRSVTLLDTRNVYETKLGTFSGARTLGIDRFRELPSAVRLLPPELKHQPIIMFCTGGIRCEKAGPFMENEGFEHIFQLDGGILRYFEEVGGDHYEGECFVFDQRVGVDPALRETDSALCHVCQAPLTASEQADPRYVPDQSCPFCFKSPEEEMARRIDQRHKFFRRFAQELESKDPAENRRPLNVPGRYDGVPLLDCLAGMFPHIPQAEWLELCAHGRIRNREDRPLAASEIVRAGDRLNRLQPPMLEPAINSDIRILHEDEAIVVLNKPAPLPMHPGGRFNRHTLQHFLHAAYAPQNVQAAHRLDANTTGLVICTRIRRFATLLQPQFAAGTVEKLYLARVSGLPAWETFVSQTPISAEPGFLGSRHNDETQGQTACTEFRVLSRHSDGTVLLEVRPKTGRTNQIRIHLWELGFPICGDPTYLAGNQVGIAQTLPLGAPPLCLHAWQIAFDHPQTRQRISFTAEPPAWASLLLS